MVINNNKEIFPIAIFLDTNILDSLPENLRAGDLSGLVADCNNIGATVYIPDVVSREWLKHRIDKFFISLSNYLKSRSHIKKYFPNIPDFNINIEEFKNNVYRTLISFLKKSGCRLLGPPKASIIGLTDRAINAIPPFRYANRGFKDELVVLSMFKLEKRGWNYNTYVLITKDNDFPSEDLKRRFISHEVKFERVNSLREARNFLETKLDETWKRYKAQIESEVKEFLSKHWEIISKAVIEQIEEKGISRWILFGLESKDISKNEQIKRIVKSIPRNIDSVDVGREDEITHEIPLTISVQTQISLEVEENPFLYEALFGKVGIEGWKTESKPVFQRESKTVNIDRQILLYAVAIRDDNNSLSELQFVEMRPDYQKSFESLDKSGKTSI